MPQKERMSWRQAGGIFSGGQIIFPSGPLTQHSGRDTSFEAIRGSEQWRVNIEQWIANVNEMEALSTFQEDLDQWAPLSESHLTCRVNDSRDDTFPLFFVQECPQILLRRHADIQWAIEKATISNALAESRERWEIMVPEAGSLDAAIERATWSAFQEQYRRIGLELDRPGSHELEPFEVHAERRRRHAWRVLTLQTHERFVEKYRVSG
ncbi:hypothetical protein EDC01DRAFT_630636 [Geopyxis carbonaria]|nr:hypothetical protein EDC01DRAFT_630636 [Geopyxis carbonaria]